MRTSTATPMGTAVPDLDASATAEASSILTVQPAAISSPTASPTPPLPPGPSLAAPAPAPPPGASGQPVAIPALAAAGISLAIPTVPAPGAALVVGQVPVPLAPLAVGALVLPRSPAITTNILNQLLATTSVPVPVSAAVSSASGGTIVAGNVGISFSPRSLAGFPSTIRVDVTTAPAIGMPGGPAQFSPNGTLLDISISDPTTGATLTTFPDAVTVTLKYNGADLGQANGDPSMLGVAYVIDAASPDIENPNHFPAGTFVLFEPEAATLDAANGLIRVQTQAIGSAFTVLTQPLGYVQTLAPDTREFSSFDPATSLVFAVRPQFTYLQVVEPQIGMRLMVLDPRTNNYAYVNARDVGPSGPPPSKVAAARALDLMRN